MTNFHFGENLRLVRTAKGISQKEMAQHLKVSPPTYLKIEGGKKVPSLDIVEGIARILDVTKAELLPRSRQVYEAKAILKSPFGIILIIACFCSLGPGLWGLTDAICTQFGVSEDTTVILRRLSIAETIIILWYGVSRVKKGGKYEG